MSQAGELAVLENHPEILTEVITDSGTAVPIAHVMEFLGEVVANNNIPFRSIGSGNTVTYQIQYAAATASTNIAEVGVASFDSSTFAVDGNGFVTLLNSGGASIKITQYDADGSWTIDPRSVKVDMYAWSGGGGGGSGRCGISNSAGGGGSGGCNYVFTSFNASDLSGSPYTVTIGLGGTGGTSVNAATTNGNNGNPGGSTSVGTVLVTGQGNFGSSGKTGSSGSAGGNLYINGNFLGVLGSQGVAGSLPTVENRVYSPYSSAAGAPGYSNGSSRVGLAGGNITDGAGTVLVAGGTAGTPGGNGGNGNSPPTDAPFNVGGSGGGSGGHNGVTTAGSGGNGGVPGGPGGGGAGNLSSNPSGAGGNGANGRVIIVEYF